MGNPWGGHNRRKDPIERVTHELGEIACALERIADKMPEAPAASVPQLGFHLSRIEGVPTMSDKQLDPVNLPDNMKAQYHVNSDARVDQGGAALSASDFQFSSSDTSVLSVEPGDDEWSAWVTTPNPGSANLVLTFVPTGDTVTQPIVVGKTAPGNLGMFADPPVTE